LDLLIILFFLFSVFYFFKNTLWGSFNFSTIEVYKKSIRNLKVLLKKEEEKNRKLKDQYDSLIVAKNETLEAFIRDYLFYIKPNEQIILVPQNRKE